MCLEEPLGQPSWPGLSLLDLPLESDQARGSDKLIRILGACRHRDNIGSQLCLPELADGLLSRSLACLISIQSQEQLLCTIGLESLDLLSR